MKTLSLDEVKDLLNSGKPLFDRDPEATMKQFMVATHPDRFAGDTEKTLRALALMEIARTMYEAATRKFEIKSPRRTYTVSRLIASGDVADVYRATHESTNYIVKASRIPIGAGMLKREAEVLARLHTKANMSSFSHFIPILCETFPVRDSMAKHVNVFDDPSETAIHEEKLYTLEEIKAQHPQLDGRHIAWIFKRLLSILGLAHSCGVVHGAVLPCHILVDVATHGIKLIGWGQSVDNGQVIKRGSSKYLPFYPKEVSRKQPVYSQTDIYMAAKVAGWLYGGPIRPPIVSNFLRSILMEGPLMRPGSAWGVHDEFAEVLLQVYGKPKFVELQMS